jgi:endonuclease YncB( thermonuclease family)
MGTLLPNHRLPRGPAQRQSKPEFQRRGPARFSGLRQYFGFFALAAMMAAAAMSLGFRQDAGVLHSQIAPRQEPVIMRTLHGVRVTVLDGDSLRAGNEDIRLIGIDAPKLFQVCRDEHGRQWNCGRAAKARLEALVSMGEIACTARGHDRYGRTLAVCSAGDINDIGETLVREGYAVDYGDFRGGYPAAEYEARATRRGLWRGDFDRPQDWRRRHPRKG